MISEKITNEELEMMAAKPVNNLALVPNHPLAVKMAKELLALRKAFSEPFCCTTSHEVEYMQRGDGGSMWNMDAFDEGDVLLYRKPD